MRIEPGDSWVAWLAVVFVTLGAVMRCQAYLPPFQVHSSVSPDPQTGTVAFHVKADADWRGTVTIRDKDGRLIRILYYVPFETHPSGAAVFPWDLADQKGQRVGPGEYAIRVEAVKMPHENSPRDIYTMLPVACLDAVDEGIWVMAFCDPEPPVLIGHFEETLMRKFDFDGLPLSDEIPLTGVHQICQHNNFTVDIHDQIYICGGNPWQDRFRPSTINRFDGGTGRRVWSNTLALHSEWMLKERDLISGSVGMADTMDEVALNTGATHHNPRLYAFDAGTGKLRGEIPLDRAAIAVYNASHSCSVSRLWDGGYFIEYPAFARFDKDGKLRWCGTRGGELNYNEAIIDLPVSPREREFPHLGGHENVKSGCDIAGNIYFQAGTGPWPNDYLSKITFPPGKGQGSPAPQGIIKTDGEGQIALGVALEGGNQIDVSADGKLLMVLGTMNDAYTTHPLWLYQADWAESAVRVSDDGKAIPVERIPPAHEALFKKYLEGAKQGDFRDDFNMGRLLYCLKRCPESIPLFEKVLKATEDPAYRLAGYLYVMRAFCRLGEYEKAVASMKKMAGALPGQACRANLKIAECYQALGAHDKAIASCQKAVEKAENKYWKDKATLALGEAHRRAGDIEKAVRIYDDALRTAPDAASEALLRIARIREGQGQWEEAARLYRRVASEYYSRRSWVVAKDLERCFKNGVKRESVSRVYPKSLALAPSKVLGQRTIMSADFASFSYTDWGPNRLNEPMGVLSYGGNLYVADFWEWRVSIYRNTRSLANDQPADSFLEPRHVLFPKDGNKRALSVMFPVSITADGKRLYVSDYWANRILIYAGVPVEGNPAPSLALGQPDLATMGIDQTAPAAETLYHPFGIHSDGNRLFVVDRGNHRLLIWNSLPATNQAPASVVLGQPDFGSNERNAGGLSARSLNRPGWVFSTGRQLIVSDTMNHRVLIWNHIPTRNFEPADIVLGQPDFSTCVGWPLLGTGSMSLQEFSCPNGVFVDEKGRLYLADSFNSRILIWDEIPKRSHQEPDHVVGDINTTTYGHAIAKDETPSVRGLFFMAIWADENHFYISDFMPSRILVIPRESLEKALAERAKQ